MDQSKGMRWSSDSSKTPRYSLKRSSIQAFFTNGQFLQYEWTKTQNCLNFIPSSIYPTHTPRKSFTLPPTSPKPLTLTSSRLPSNDHVTILGAVENLVNMLKSMSPCLPTISFPLQSPCLQCQAAISVSMTRLRVLLSHHPSYTPSDSEAVLYIHHQDNTLQTGCAWLIIQYLTIGVLPYLTASRVLLSRHPRHASSHYPTRRPPARHKIPKMCAPPKNSTNSALPAFS